MTSSSRADVFSFHWVLCDKLVSHNIDLLQHVHVVYVVMHHCMHESVMTHHFLAMMMLLDHGHVMVKRHTYLYIVKKYYTS